MDDIVCLLQECELFLFSSGKYSKSSTPSLSSACKFNFSCKYDCLASVSFNISARNFIYIV